MNRLANNTNLKRKQKLYKDLVESFGGENKALIDSEIDRNEQYLKEGFLYQDVLGMVKENISGRLGSLQTDKGKGFNLDSRRATISNARSISPNTKFSNVSSNQEISMSKRSNELPDYSEYYTRFYEESSNINKNIDKVRSLGYVRRPTLQISAKVDEVRAMAAAKEREEQGRLVEYQREMERIAAEKETVRFQCNQIKDKNEFSNLLKQEDRVYGKQLEERKRFLEKIDYEERFRQKQQQKVYLQALDEQMSYYNNDKVHLKRLEYEGKKILTPEPYESGKSSPVSMSPSWDSRSSFITPTQSPLKFLAQYGNFVVHKGKK